ncbi:acyltransferase [Lysobacter sp. CFH 32150]|uniref:LpxL/LpxP family acyltransferase n=1 Tax=Lysobacter sp. CFH 32150 TaxID=2927128 RepID=UPI001FA6B82C|nr:acyltransferase [Lysobacter sp. CFH 32150]MCI4569164.1 acyltransferase [Lysobacter sp. CFH 32150]
MSGWKQRPEGGGRFALWLIRTIARCGGRVVGRLCLYPITLYFLLMRGPERRASRDYLQRVFGHRVGWFAVARHIHTFAATILDRVFLLSEQLRRFDVDLRGVDALHTQLDRGGVLLFGSHLGSFEVLRVLARTRPDVKIRVLLDKGHNQAITELLDALNPEIAATVIDAGQDGPSIVLAIQQAVQEGALVALLVDRAHPGEVGVPATFLGERAMFPAAPWLIASALRAPVVLAFGLYRGGKHYELTFEPFSDAISIARQDRPAVLGELVQRYAARLEHHTRSAPYNWFNFYDYWQTDDANHPVRTPRTAARRRVA